MSTTFVYYYYRTCREPVEISVFGDCGADGSYVGCEDVVDGA